MACYGFVQRPANRLGRPVPQISSIARGVDLLCRVSRLVSPSTLLYLCRRREPSIITLANLGILIPTPRSGHNISPYRRRAPLFPFLPFLFSYIVNSPDLMPGGVNKATPLKVQDWSDLSKSTLIHRLESLGFSARDPLFVGDFYLCYSFLYLVFCCCQYPLDLVGIFLSFFFLF